MLFRSLQNAQNIANNNVATRNAQQQFNRGLEQQQFQNQIQRAGGVASGYNNMANLNLGNANATANMFAQMGGAVGSGLAANAMSGAGKQQPFTVGDQSVSNGGFGVKRGNGFME